MGLLSCGVKPSKPKLQLTEQYFHNVPKRVTFASQNSRSCKSEHLWWNVCCTCEGAQAATKPPRCSHQRPQKSASPSLPPVSTGDQPISRQSSFGRIITMPGEENDPMMMAAYNAKPVNWQQQPYSPQQQQMHQQMQQQMPSQQQLQQQMAFQDQVNQQQQQQQQQGQGQQYQSNEMVSPRVPVVSFKVIINEMKAKQFDSIRFAAYRTASKLRYIQQRIHFTLLDIWNVIEAFRQSGLHTVDAGAQLERCRVEETVGLMYGQLNMRLPASRQINAVEATALMLAWLLHSYDTTGRGQIRVLALKVALSTLAAGKPLDKFRYHFTLLSDPSGALVPSRFEQYLHDLLVLAVGVFEGSNFAYDQQVSRFMLTGRSRSIVIEEFLSRMLTDPGPQCLLWLTIFHRIAHVQNVKHSVRCEVCRREGIVGFRYKCQRCHNYNLCQDCFWTGGVTGSHNNQHDVKEYTSSKSHSRQFGHSLRKSFGKGSASPSPRRAGPITSMDGMSDNTLSMGRGNHHLARRPLFPGGQMMEPTPCNRQMDLTHIVPPTFPSNRMVSQLNQSNQLGMMASSSQSSILNVQAMDRNNMPSPSPSMVMTSNSTDGHNPAGHNNNHHGNSNSQQQAQQPRRPTSFPFDPNRIDDEHRLIARYAARLASDSNDQTRKHEQLFDGNLPPDSTRLQKELVMKLEAKNREILKEIQRLRLEQAAATAAANNGGVMSPSQQANNPTLLVELRALRQRKDELEMRMMNLQESRKELMGQLGSLMHLLKTDSSGGGSVAGSMGSGLGGSYSGGNGTLGSNPGGTMSSTGGGSLRGTPLGGRMKMAPRLSTGSLEGTSSSYLSPALNFSQNSGDPQGRTAIRHDLLLAADSVTHAMSSLVRELNSDNGPEDGGGGQQVVIRGNGVGAGMGGRGPLAPGSSEYEAEYERALEGDKNRDVPAGGINKGHINDSQYNTALAQRMMTEQRFLSELQARREQQQQQLHNQDHLLQPGVSPTNIGGPQQPQLNNINSNNSTAAMPSAAMVHSAGVGVGGHQRAGSYTSQDSESEAYLYSDPECLGGGGGGGGRSSQDEMTSEQRFGSHNNTKPQPRYRRYTTDEETDHESYIRTDDEDGGNTDWEDNMRRWVNR